jgi:predicted nucleotidyltransferase
MKWGICELALFGSAVRDDFRPDSDLDFLVSFSPNVAWGLLDHAAMEREFAEIVGRPVDPRVGDAASAGGAGLRNMSSGLPPALVVAHADHAHEDVAARLVFLGLERYLERKQDAFLERAERRRWRAIHKTQKRLEPRWRGLADSARC